MRHQYCWLIAVCGLLFMAACQPVQPAGSTHAGSTMTEVAPAAVAEADVINIFIPLENEALEPLYAWLNEQQLTERVHITSSHDPGQKLDAWLYPKGAQAYYDVKVSTLEELNNVDWSLAQFEDSNSENPWSATLIKTGGDEHVADVLGNIEEILAHLPNEAPPLISPSEIVNPDDVMRVQIRSDGTLMAADVICSPPFICHSGTACIRCSGGRWCPIRRLVEVSIFAPIDADTLNLLQAQIEDLLPETPIKFINTLEAGQAVDAWIVPGDAQPASTMLIETLSALDNINWTVAQLKDVDPQKAWSIGILNTGGTEHVEQVVQGLNVLISQDPTAEYLPSSVANFDNTSISQLQVSQDGILVSKETPCKTCKPLTE